MPISSSIPSPTFKKLARSASEPNPVNTRTSVSTSKVLPSAGFRASFAFKLRQSILKGQMESALDRRIKKYYPNGSVSFTRLCLNGPRAWIAEFSCRDDQGRRKHVAYAEQKEDVAREILRWLEYTPIDRQAVEKYNRVIAALAEKGAGGAGLYQKKDGDYFYLLVLHPVFGGKTAALTEDKAIQLMYDYLTSYYFGTGKQNAYTPKLSKEDFALWKEIVDTARYKYNSQILFKFIRDGTDIDCIMKMTYHISHNKIVAKGTGTYAFSMAVRAMHARMKESAHVLEGLDFSDWKP